MRLSCNFVKVYTIAYRAQYTFTRVQARVPNGHPREENRAACRIKTAKHGSRKQSHMIVMDSSYLMPNIMAKFKRDQTHVG